MPKVHCLFLNAGWEGGATSGNLSRTGPWELNVQEFFSGKNEALKNEAENDGGRARFPSK